MIDVEVSNCRYMIDVGVPRDLPTEDITWIKLWDVSTKQN